MDGLVIPFLLALAAGLSTGLGGLVVFFIKKFDRKALSFLLGFSAGVMIFVSFVELLPHSMEIVGFESASLWFLAGLLALLAVDYLVPHIYKQEKAHPTRSLLTTSILIAFGIIIHNVPEGFAVLLSGLSDLKLGILLAFAIGIHNIPEGIVVALPVLYATKNKWKAFKYSLISGLAEPAAALVGGLILFPFINNTLIGSLLAFAAGAMIFICLDELIPTAHDYSCEEKNYTGHSMIFGIIFGMVVMMASIWLLR